MMSDDASMSIKVSHVKQVFLKMPQILGNVISTPHFF